ncbi:Mitochondrial import receptor subunit, partial [Parasponia andersonii]
GFCIFFFPNIGLLCYLPCLSICQNYFGLLSAEHEFYFTDAISKLEEALLVKPKKHDTICLLGKAHGFLALYTPDLDKATEYFVKATEYIQQAIDMEPENELYRESLRTVDLIHEVRYQFYGDGLGYPGIVAAGPSSSSGSKTAKMKKTGNLGHEIYGWIFAAACVFALGFAKSRGRV